MTVDVRVTICLNPNIHDVRNTLMAACVCCVLQCGVVMSSAAAVYSIYRATSLGTSLKTALEQVMTNTHTHTHTHTHTSCTATQHSTNNRHTPTTLHKRTNGAEHRHKRIEHANISVMRVGGRHGVMSFHARPHARSVAACAAVAVAVDVDVDVAVVVAVVSV